MPVSDDSITAPLSILVLEDEFNQGVELKARLEDSGFRVDWYQDADTALSVLTRTRYDCVLADVFIDDMAEGRGGLSLISAIKQLRTTRDAETPVVAISGVGGQADGLPTASLAQALGADEFFCKPLDHDALLKTIVSLIAARGGRLPEPPRVLLLEDDFRQAYEMQGHLTSGGYICDVVEDLNSALERVASGDYGLVVADIYTKTPGRGGFFLAAAIKQLDALKLPDLPVIAISGVGSDSMIAANREYAMELGVDAFLRKPIPTNVLVETVREVLAERNAMKLRQGLG
ncbi:MAG: response regulator [Pseudomonadota bacterium]